MDDYRDHLFSYIPPDRLRTFTYGHVIPPGNLTVQALPTGILASDFIFTHEKRKAEQMVRDAFPLSPGVGEILLYRQYLAVLTDQKDR